MERLTSRDEKGTAIAPEFANETYIMQDDNDVFTGYINSPIVDRLAELEDKLDEGIPFEPLCKVGDIVYQLLKSLTTPDMSIEPLTIVSAKFYEDAILYICKDSWQLTSYVESTKLNENWFLTREEAEKRLEELRK